MKSLLRTFLFAALALVATAQEQKPGGFALDRLAWLAGDWRLERAGRVTDEQWMAPAGGVMLGMSRTVAKGKVAEHEFLQLREGPGGDLFYVALPARQKEATFKAVTQTENEVVFENKEHDFPQVIGYRLNADGSLLAWIEGPRADGTTRRVEYPYRRAAK
ncbi:MAG: hypothetical protein QG602_2651 [Verrucomicrobiota bacterium]|nr:hypothetical protein [Verrucomicrobiota bacterium]